MLRSNQAAEWAFLTSAIRSLFLATMMYFHKVKFASQLGGSSIYHLSMVVVAAKLGIRLPEVRARAEEDLSIWVLSHRFSDECWQYRCYY